MTDTNTAQMVADLTSANNVVQGNSWVSPELGGSGGSLGLLDSTLDPLTGLASAGLGWFTPFVSFLSDGLGQLQGGSSASVTSGSQDFGNAGQSLTDLGGSYGNSVNAQTSNWSGPAASDYRNTGTQAATGVAGLGAGSSTVGSSIIGAGQVVAEAISEIAELIGEAVSQIVPILTQAIARAQQTMGESVLEAIPPCVGIAVEYAARIAAKLAALLASGQNLLKLVQGALGVVDLIQQALSSISQQSTQAGTDPSASTGAGTTQSPAVTPPPTMDSASTGSTPPTTDGSDGSGDTPTSDTSADPGAPLAPVDPSSPTDLGSSPVPGADPFTTQSAAAVVPPFHTAMSTAPAYPVSADGGQGGALPVGAAGIGIAAGAAGARNSAAGAVDTVRQGRRFSTSTTPTEEGATPDGVPLAGRPGGAADKEHKRKYTVVEQHDEILDVVPPVITTSPTND